MSDQQTTLAPLTPATAGAFSLVPTSLTEAMKFAELIAKSDLAPKDYKGKPENVLIAVQMGLELRLSPMQALQNISVINGKPALYGDAVLAVVRGSGQLEAIVETIDGPDNEWVATCAVKRRGEAPMTRTFSMADAKRAKLSGKEGPWTQYPKRMLQMRARSFALRDAFADVLRGINVAEELGDIVEGTVTAVDGVPREPQRLVAPVTASPETHEGAAPATTPPAANGAPLQQTRGVQVADTKMVTPTPDQRFYQVTLVQPTGEVVPGMYVARDEAIYQQLASVEGSEHLVVVTWKPVSRPNGESACLIQSVALDEGGAA